MTVCVDMGYGNVKVAVAEPGAEAKPRVFPAFVGIPRESGIAAQYLGGSEEMTGAVTPVILDNGETYLVGPGVVGATTPVGFADYTALVSAPYKALMFHALVKTIGWAAVKSAPSLSLYLALPAGMLEEGSQWPDVVRNTYIGEHTFKVGRRSVTLNVEKVGILHQATAAATSVIDPAVVLKESAGRVTRVAVVSFGRNTIEYSIVEIFPRPGGVGLRVLADKTGGFAGGVRELLNKSGVSDLSTYDLLLREGRFAPPQDVLSGWVLKIANQLSLELGDDLRTSRVILIGGGVEVLRKYAPDLLAKTWPEAIIPPNPITAVVEGVAKIVARLV